MTKQEAKKLTRGDYVCMNSGIRHQGRVTETSEVGAGYIYVAWRGAKTQKVPVGWIEADAGASWSWAECL